MFDKNLNCKKGAMLLMLMVLLAIVGITASKLIPSEELITRRSKESSLNTELSQIRESFDLMKIASPSWEPWQEDFDPDHPDAAASIAQVLQLLSLNGYLRNENLADPGVLPHQWGITAGKRYWLASGNLASNSSFQIGTGNMAGWNWNQVDTLATSDNIFPNDVGVDDFPYQNKLGILMRNTGSSLKIIH